MADRQKVATLPPAETLKHATKKAYEQNNVGNKLWQNIIGSSQRTNAAVDQTCGIKNTFAPKRDKQ